MDKTCTCKEDELQGLDLDEEWPAPEEDPTELWAEAGGYAAGLPRPLSPHERRAPAPEPDDWEDIPY